MIEIMFRFENNSEFDVSSQRTEASIRYVIVSNIPKYQLCFITIALP